MIPWSEYASFEVQRYALVPSRQVEAHTDGREKVGIVAFCALAGVDEVSVGVGVFHAQPSGCGESIAPLRPPRSIYAVHHLAVYEAVAFGVEVEVIVDF